jgi:hypothetical protein
VRWRRSARNPQLFSHPHAQRLHAMASLASVASMLHHAGLRLTAVPVDKQEADVAGRSSNSLEDQLAQLVVETDIPSGKLTVRCGCWGCLVCRCAAPATTSPHAPPHLHTCKLQGCGG